MSGARKQDQGKIGQSQVKASLLLESPEESTPEIHGEPRAGDLCPRCGKARLDYDGLLNLACPECGYALGGCFT